MNVLDNDLECIVNSLPFPTIILNTDIPYFTIAGSNDSYLKIKKLNKARIAGREFRQLLSKAEAEILTEAVLFVVRTKQPHCIEKFRQDIPSFSTGIPEERYWKIYTYPLLNANGTVSHVIQSLTDITGILTAPEIPLKEWCTKELQTGTSPVRSTAVQEADMAEYKRSRQIERLEKDVLTKHADKNISIREILTFFATAIESVYPDIYCSIMRVRENRLYNWVSPSLPGPYTKAIEGLPIGMNVGSCGTAAFLKKRVIVSDIANDHRWKGFCAIALQHNLKACWSHPIIDDNNEVMATFALYYSQVREPSEEEIKVIERLAALLQIIMANRLYSEVVKENAVLMTQAQELARFGNWSWDISNNVVKWSDTLYAIYGIEKKDFKATFEGYRELLHPDDRKMAANKINEVLTTRKDGEFEERIIRPDGEIRYLKSWAKLICDESENPVRMIGACLDITESKSIQNELLAGEERLSNMVERYTYVNKATNDAIYDWDIISNNIQWGEAFYRIFGYTADDKAFPLEKWEAMVHPNDINQILASLDATLNNEKKRNWTTEYHFRKADGQYAIVEENGYILRDDAGKAQRMIGVLKDITERKAAEAELQLSKDRYSDLFHLSPLPMLVYELDSFRFLDVNDAAIAHYGYSLEEFLRMTIKDIVMPADAFLLENIIRKEIKSGISHKETFRHVKKNGDIMLVNTNGNTITYNGKKARIVVAIDNTDKLKAEEAMMLSERRFKTMIQDSTDLIAILDTAGRFRYVSPAAERVVGIKDEELTGRKALDFILQEDEAAVEDKVKDIDKQKRIQLKPFRYKNAFNEIRWAETIITDKRDDPAINGIIANARDITNRMASELKTKELLERYNAVSKATSDAIWDLNLSTNEIVWNHALIHIFGYHDLIQTYDWWRERVHPDDIETTTDIVDYCVQTKESRWTAEYRFRCADGNYKTVLDRGFLIFNEQGQPMRMIGSMQDITERMKYIHTIEEHNKRLREIAWTQSHVVRAPLARIMGLVPLIADEDTDIDTRQILLSHLLISADELDEIIRQIIMRSQL